MGKTSFLGPVYGAKALLVAFGPVLGDQNTSTAAAWIGSKVVVPNYEDWFITEASLSVSTHSSSPQSFILKSEGGSTTGILRPDGVSTKAQNITSWATTTSTTTAPTLNTVTGTAGEYEGLWVPAGSTIRLVSSGASAPALVTLQVHGFKRFVDSTRAS